MKTKLIIFKVTVGVKDEDNPVDVIRHIKAHFDTHPQPDGYSITHYILPNLETTGIDIQLLYPQPANPKHDKDYFNYLIDKGIVPKDLLDELKAEIK